MTKANCYYIVRARLDFYNQQTFKIEFRQIEEKFENDNPIVAREKAFNYFDSFIHSLLLGQSLSEKEIESLNDRQIRATLNPSINSFKKNDSEEGFTFTNCVYVLMIINGNIDNEIEIHSLRNDKQNLPFPPNCGYLEEEFEFYLSNNYDTKNYATTVNYFDYEEYFDGYEETAFGTHKILKTPFDWTGYDTKNWWGTEHYQDEPAENINRQDYIKELIERGEGEQIEFKPTLVYHFEKKAYSLAVRHIIAKTICAFLNSSGGYLFIGVTDSKEIQGLQYDFTLTRPNWKDPKDYFKLEVDKIIRDYFKDIASNIRGDFEIIGSTEVFMFTIFPSKNYPVFLKGQNGKEFYVRLTASSEPYTDIEEITRYCLSHWNFQK